MPDQDTQPTAFEGIDIIRSEEQAVTTVARTVIGRLLVGKRITTEERTITVTVRREEFYLQEIDHRDDDSTTAGEPATAADLGAGREVVIVLREEVPVVSTKVADTERVRVIVVGTTQDTGTVVHLAKEVIEVTPSLPGDDD